MHSTAHVPAPTARTHSSASTHARTAFTLIEVLFALTIVSAALLALEVTTTRTVQRIADTHREALAADLARQQLDRLIASPCAPSAGVDSVNNILVSWTAQVTTSTPRIATVTQHAKYPLVFGMHHDSLTTLIPCH